MLPTARFRDVLDSASRFVALPSWDPYSGVCWFEAQCLVESNGDPNARHYDGNRDPNHQDQQDSEEWASYGLFQIEGITARGLFGNAPGKYDYSFLYLPLLNIITALRVIAANLHQYQGDVPKTLAAYNGGGWGAKENAITGKLNNQVYVDRVRSRCVLVQLDRV